MVISIFDLKKFCTKNTTNRKKANQTNCTYQKSPDDEQAINKIKN